MCPARARPPVVKGPAVSGVWCGRTMTRQTTAASWIWEGVATRLRTFAPGWGECFKKKKKKHDAK
ncbi:hypothetical protein NX96_14180 [Staphylococcus aureus]|nr:hypothetical protein NX96_14180 [Staphylococcus aureus]